jgi:hypothetical protein
VAAVPIPSPKRGRELIDDFFIENRNRLLEIAAFLDRIDRTRDTGAEEDFRMRGFREALAVLSEGSFPRVEQIQMLFSDPTVEPLEQLDQKGARGAYDRWQESA